MKTRNTIEYSVRGKNALFTDPITKTGGEKFSYQVPTYEALKGITESIYWKPTFTWIIDEVRILMPIEFQSKGIRPIHYHDLSNDLSIYTYLSNVAYQVRAHFEWNLSRPELEMDRNENKHWDIAKRMIEKGGRREIFLGTRECQGYVEPCNYGSGTGYYEGLNLDFGIMFHGFTYTDESSTKKDFMVRLDNIRMESGIIRFKRPDQCTIVKPLRKLDMKSFEIGKNIKSVDLMNVGD